MPVSTMQASLKPSRGLRLAGIACLAATLWGPALAQSDGNTTAGGQQNDRVNAEHKSATQPSPDQDEQQATARYGDAPDAETLLGVNVNSIWPGSVSGQSEIKTPPMDTAAADAGMNYYNTMNCIGCHAPNGSGGMGPALSNDVFIYGGKPEEIFLTIKQGRPNGMPAYGTLLPDASIWQLVAYVKSISKDPGADSWGTTVSLDAMTIEQVPAEYQTTSDPWSNTKAFSYGQDPYEGSQPPQQQTAAAGDGEEPSDAAEGLKNGGSSEGQEASGERPDQDGASQ